MNNKLIKYKDFLWFVNCKYLMKCWILLLMPFLSCADDNVNSPLEKGGKAPAQVTEVKAVSTPGGADITYLTPADANLSYVEAVVETTNGKRFEYKSSAYNSEIKVIGLGNREKQIVKLYSVNRGGVKSAPVEVPIYPLDPPFVGVLQTLKMKEDCGGVNIKFENISTAELAFTLGVYDEKGRFIEQDTHYSNAKNGTYTWRGYPSVETKFGVCIRDRWDNFSDTLSAVLTPLFEELLDKVKFRDLTLDNDAKIFTTEANIAKANLWNGQYGTDFTFPNNYGNYLNMTTEFPNTLEPHTITIDLGQTAQLSRMRVNHYYRYIDRAPRRYEIWGCTDTPHQDGRWSDWTKIASFEQIKPSGLPGETYGPGDAEAWLAGDDIVFVDGIPPIRYIRIRCLENWQGTTHMSMAEVTFWGSSAIQ